MKRSRQRGLKLAQVEGEEMFGEQWTTAYIKQRSLNLREFINPKSASTFVNIISSSDTCFTVTWAIM